MRRRITALLLTLVLVFSLAGCSKPALENLRDGRDSGSGESEDTEESGGGDEQDSEVRYQDDFYEYVNQDLLDQITLQATDAHWDWFGELNAIVSEEMDQIIEELAADGQTYPKGSSEQKIKDMYECVSNMENRNQTGLGPLQPHIDRKSVV